MTIRTIKIPYTCSDTNFEQVYAQINREQANIIRYSFNRFKDGFNEKQIRLELKKLNNITQDTWFQQSAIRAALAIYDSCVARKQEKVIFGRTALVDYKNHKISKEQLKEARTFGISSIGESPKKGNRKFSFISFNEIIFKPNRKQKFSLILNSKNNYKEHLQSICKAANAKETPITVRINKTHIFISFDVTILKSNNYKPKANRVLGIDMNPNRFAYCIKDENKILKAEALDFMELRLFSKKGFSSDSKEKKYLTNKKKHEVLETAHYFIKQALAMHCEAVAIETLQGMKSQGNNKHFNRSVNNDFKRKLFSECIEKLCAIHGIRFVEILPQYTSFMGCVLYGSVLPDPLSAAACVADAGIIFLKNNKLGNKRIAWFNAIQLDKTSTYLNSTYLNQWKKEDLCFDSIKELYNSVKRKFPLGDMSLSYHTHLCTAAIRSGMHKTSKSKVLYKLVLYYGFGL